MISIEELIVRKRRLVHNIYITQKSNSKKRGHRAPEYSEAALYDWLYSQTKFHELYDEWKQSGFKTRLRPSIDRKNNQVHYCMSNIQLMTWEENRRLFFDDITAGRVTVERHKMSIQQVSKSGEVIEVFDSIGAAAHSTGISKSGISRCGRGERKSAGGYHWRIKD